MEVIDMLKRLIENFLITLVGMAGAVIGLNVGTDVYKKEKETKYYSNKIKNLIEKVKTKVEMKESE